jgi:phosphohistidine phosphatase
MDRDEFQESKRAQGDVSDDLRPLTPKGIKKMRRNAKGIHEFFGKPDLLVSSPLMRALETAHILQEEWPGCEFAIAEELRPDSNPADLAEWLRSRHVGDLPQATVAVVGHEPHLSHMVAWFLSGSAKDFVELKKGGACCLEFNRQMERGKARLLWLAPPGMLKT